MLSSKGPKIDKGFELMYFRLSYRRKFLRTLWFSPGIFIFYPGVFTPMPSLGNMPVFLLMLVITVAQAGFNLYMWRTRER